VALYLEREKHGHLEGLEDGSLRSVQVQGRPRPFKVPRNIEAREVV